MARLSIELASNIPAFFSKEIFVVRTHASIQNFLDGHISRIARNQFGLMAGTLAAPQLSLITTAIVANFVGDMIYWTVREFIHTIVSLARLILFGVQDKPRGTIMRELANRMASYMAYFFSGTLFANISLNSVRTILDFTCRKIIRISTPPFSSGLVTSSLAMMWASPVTAFLAEVVGTITYVAVYNYLNRP
jgi:hypothetical protein